MTLQQLEYFLAAYRHGSFSAAAEELHLAQPSLSEQIRRLEAELGVAVVRAHRPGVAPTEAGETLRPHAERTLAAAEAARESVVAVRELRGGIATFGTWATARYYPGTEIVAAFRRRHPEVRVRVIGQNSFEVVEAVRRGEIEAGMVALPVDDRGLDVQPIMRDELVYASVDRGRLRRAMTIEALVAAPLILYDASYGTDDPTRRRLAELAQRIGATIEPQIDVEDVEAAHRARGRRARRHDRRARDAPRARPSRATPSRVGAVRPADPRPVRVHLPPRRPPVARQPASSCGSRRSASPRSRRRWRRGRRGDAGRGHDVGAPARSRARAAVPTVAASAAAPAAARNAAPGPAGRGERPADRRPRGEAGAEAGRQPRERLGDGALAGDLAREAVDDRERGRDRQAGHDEHRAEHQRPGRGDQEDVAGRQRGEQHDEAPDRVARGAAAGGDRPAEHARQAPRGEQRPDRALRARVLRERDRRDLDRAERDAGERLDGEQRPHARAGAARRRGRGARRPPGSRCARPG